MSKKNISRRKALKLKFSGIALLILGPISTSAKSILSGAAEITTDIWEKLRHKINGSLVSQKQENFEATRLEMIWNGRKPVERPDAIVHVSNEADIQKSVQFANSQGLKVSIRGRGHHVHTPCMRDNGILLDISGLNELKINVETKSAIAGPGVLGSELAVKLSEKSLAFPVGHCPTVPLSGYILGGGFGWNSGAWGPACYNVKAIDVVTATGEVIHADSRQNADYYWAARGSGPGFFGIVSRYYLQLYPQPECVLSGNITYPMEATEVVANWLDELLGKLAPQVEISCMQISALASNGKPAKRLTVNAVAFANTEEQARNLLKPLESCPGNYTSKKLYSKTSITELHDSAGKGLPGKTRYAEDAFITDAKPSEYLMGLCAIGKETPSPLSSLLIGFRPVSKAKSIDDGMVFSMAGNAFIAAYGAWDDPDTDPENIDWIRKVASFMAPFTKGYYVNESDIRFSDDRPSRCFSPGNWARLQMLKNKHDPEEMFTYFPPTKK